MSFDLCAIGNACIDIAARVDDDFLNAWNFQKSICTYLELARADALEAALPDPAYIPGGCGANTAATIAALGGTASFIGRIADDAIGARFTEDMRARGIRFDATPDRSAGAGSTRIFALTTPDAERTFAAYYGVQEALSTLDLDEGAIAESKFMYLDGYALNSREGGDTFLTAARIARENGQRVIFSPSDLSILRKYPGIVADLTAASDGIVCNLGEAQFITGESTAERAAAKLGAMFSFGAVTMGDRGVIAFDHENRDLVPVGPLPGAVTDTNGAGDAFAGGFLFGLSRGWDSASAAALGNRCAAVIITMLGARPPLDLTSLIRR